MQDECFDELQQCKQMARFEQARHMHRKSAKGSTCGKSRVQKPMGPAASGEVAPSPRLKFQSWESRTRSGGGSGGLGKSPDVLGKVEVCNSGANGKRSHGGGGGFG